MILIAVLAALLSSGNTLKEIKFTHGFQSSELNGGTVASNAFDGDLNTQSASLEENQPWLQLYFQNYSAVEKAIMLYVLTVFKTFYQKTVYENLENYVLYYFLNIIFDYLKHS